MTGQYHDLVSNGRKGTYNRNVAVGSASEELMGHSRSVICALPLGASRGTCALRAGLIRSMTSSGRPRRAPEKDGALIDGTVVLVGVANVKTCSSEQRLSASLLLACCSQSLAPLSSPMTFPSCCTCTDEAVVLALRVGDRLKGPKSSPLWGSCSFEGIAGIAGMMLFGIECSRSEST